MVPAGAGLARWTSDSGPAGCSIASSLSRSPKCPKVLLIEAGSRRDEKHLRVDGQRWSTYRNASLNWGYKTVPREHCNGREIDYSRGKALGGSTVINFCVYAFGARDDYNHWADVVGDDIFKWDRIHARFRNLETFNGTIVDPAHAKYASPRAEDHGSSGSLHVGYAPEWEQDLPLIIDAFIQAGGVRVTAADLLGDAPDNLTFITDAPVRRVLLEGKKAVGVESLGEKKYRPTLLLTWMKLTSLVMASKEVILSAGTLDTPKILMHSGIGPAEQLQESQIPVIQDLPAVDQGLQDHFCTSLTFQRNPNTNDHNIFFKAPLPWNTPWKNGRTVAEAHGHATRVKFKGLPISVQKFLQRPTIPHYEIIPNSPLHMFMPEAVKDYSYTCVSEYLMNPQCRGEVRLQSSNPDEPLLFDPKFLSHPYDCAASFQRDTVSTLMAPASDSDEDILEYWKANLFSIWHMTGTVKMGRQDDAGKEAAVDSRFQVFGIEKLRVADISVVPVITNNHTQATAYVTGTTCAEVLKAEYKLDDID
ncbi:hypothetical protein SI65_08856 [Aspergillus cristatus]|uniref:Glucose-methanol-choline oxidoreductase N-terminal domain-containing protein n=1 Tax=Aspergillus cristatus TaxID=573508 RepID=A0A1E3B3U3_ASPCR|nr:hypothetical protein SI65_08856 [Aspergillus cristatus]